MRREKRQRRLVVFLSFYMLCMGLLLGRIFYLQLIKGNQLAERASAQRAGTYVYRSGRGEILDRNGKSLHGTTVIVQGQMLDKLSAYQIPAELLDGLVIEEEARYTRDSLASHVTGYIKKPVNPLQPQNGISGLERHFNQELWGKPHAVGVILDAKGKMVPGLGITKWEDSHLRRPYDLVTTIDRSMQEIVEKIGGEKIKKGAVVILEPKTGDILTMASFPRLPVDKLYNGTTKQELDIIQADNAYLNRAIMQYPVGSVFKVLITAAALEQNISEREGQFTCDGGYELGTNTIYCFERRPHGVVDLHQALVDSCNGYFIDLALRLGKEPVVDIARRFKLGSATGIPLGNEAAGYIPTLTDLRFGGDIANMAIGQGLVAASPLQIARMMAIIANDGRDVYPRLVLKIIDKNNNTVKSYPVQTGTQVIMPVIASELRHMLKNVITEGTASWASSSLYSAAGKSGTAEVGGSSYSRSWFAGVVDTGERALAAVVFLEEYLPGQPTASAIFRPIMEAVITAEGR